MSRRGTWCIVLVKLAIFPYLITFLLELLIHFRLWKRLWYIYPWDMSRFTIKGPNHKPTLVKLTRVYHQCLPPLTWSAGPNDFIGDLSLEIFLNHNVPPGCWYSGFFLVSTPKKKSPTWYFASSVLLILLCHISVKSVLFIFKSFLSISITVLLFQDSNVSSNMDQWYLIVIEKSLPVMCDSWPSSMDNLQKIPHCTALGNISIFQYKSINLLHYLRSLVKHYIVMVIFHSLSLWCRVSFIVANMSLRCYLFITLSTPQFVDEFNPHPKRVKIECFNYLVWTLMSGFPEESTSFDYESF